VRDLPITAERVVRAIDTAIEHGGPR
jgi:hypothetical protein